MQMEKVFTIPDELGQSLEFVREICDSFKLKQSEKNHAMLMAEESLTCVTDHRKGDKLTVSVKKFAGRVRIDMSIEGDRFDPFDSDSPNALLMKSFSFDLKYSHSHGKNRISVSAYRSRHMLIYRLIGAALLALAISMLIKNLCSEDVRQSLNDNIFSVIKDIYMNALNMIIAPLVFFSIASAIAGFQNITDIGRVGAKLLGMYLLTTILCISIGFGVTALIHPYDYAQIGGGASDVSNYTSTGIDTSVKGFLTGIVPDNFFRPFLESDTIGIMFLAFIIGIATLLAGTKAKAFRSFLESGNSVFLKIADIVVKLMPIMIFSYICVAIIPPKTKSTSVGLSSMFAAVLAFVITVVLMVLVYNLLLFFAGGLNPFIFIKKYASYAMKIMVMGSNAAIPLNMQICRELGVSSKIYSFSIPLGATVNMDGMSMYLAVFGLTFAKIYGVEITLPVLLSIAFTIIMLSAGAPAVYGISIICLSVLLGSLGVPVDEAIGQAVGLEVVAGMFRTINNCIGDMVGTLIVASREGLMDKSKYV